MIKNYFKIAVRNILRHKAYSILNISGLAIGMACSILILLWVQNELSYAVPVSWLAINNWLKGFAYHINVGWTIFLVASLAALLIAWATVSYESVKAAITNPVKSLRTE